MADIPTPAAIYTTLLEINQAVVDMAKSLERMAKSPAHLETSGALAALVERFDGLAGAIKAMPAPRVVVQAPVPALGDTADYTWTVDHETNREGTVVRSVITRSLSAPPGMTNH